MARISKKSTGSTEIARRSGISSLGSEWIYVLCSDGRILSRMRGVYSEFSFRMKVPEDKITPEYLEYVMTLDGYKGIIPK